jgi:hypothetical protein
MNQATTSQAPVQTFNGILEGVGYLNRVRLVEVKKGSPYLACTINMLKGDSNNVEYLSIDCTVVGNLAKQVVEQLKMAVNNKQKVIVGFRAGDLSIEEYEFEVTEKGVTKVVRRLGLKARLLQVTFAKVDGVKIDIPLVQRKPNSNPASQPEEEIGAGSACDDESRALAAA